MVESGLNTQQTDMDVDTLARQLRGYVVRWDTQTRRRVWSFGSVGIAPPMPAGEATIRLCGYPVLPADEDAARAILSGAVGVWRLRLRTTVDDRWVEVRSFLTSEENENRFLDIVARDVHDEVAVAAIAAQSEWLDASTRLLSRAGGERLLVARSVPGALISVHIENVVAATRLGTTEGVDEMIRTVARLLTNSGCVTGPVMRSSFDTFVILSSASDTGSALAEADQLREHLARGLSRDRLGIRPQLLCGVTFGKWATAQEALRVLARVVGDETQPPSSTRVLTEKLEASDRLEQDLITEWSRFGVALNAKFALADVVSLETKEPTEHEIHIHWEHPEHGLVTPSSVLPTLMNAGIDHDVDWFVARYLRSASLELTLPVSMDVHYATLYHSDLHLLVAALGREARLEVPEGVLVQGSERTGAVLDSLLEWGCEVYVDGFTGHPFVLDLLEHDVVTAVKLAPSIMKVSLDSRRGMSTLGAAVLLASASDVDVIATGIDTPAQERLACSVGVSHGQGSLYARGAHIAAV